MWVYQCAVCKELIRTGTATAGHIRPRSDGGGWGDENLRIECARCNEADNIRRLMSNRPSANDRILRAQCRSADRLRERKGRMQVFSNLPVFWAGRHVSFTSARRAAQFVREGLAEWIEPVGVRLTRPPSNDEPAPTDPIPNRCARCGAGKGLHRLSFYPSWHPSYRASRPSLSACPVCSVCVEVFEIAYAAAITQAAAPAIKTAWKERYLHCTRNGIAYEAWSRMKQGELFPQELVTRFDRSFGRPPSEFSLEELRRLSTTVRARLREAESEAYASIAAAVLKSGLDFPRLFIRIAANPSLPAPESLPRIDPPLF